ncbi:MAG: hypothetical protein R3C41_00210 [Calditrichia bacterium]
MDDFFTSWNFVCAIIALVAKKYSPAFVPLPIILMVPVTTFFIVMQQFAELPIEWHNVIVAILAVLVGGVGFFIPPLKQLKNKII